MKFEVYCDESQPDLLSTKKPKAKFMVIGSLWLNSDNRSLYKDEIHQLRDKHRIGPEFKWQKVSKSKLAFYKELMKCFFDKEDDLRFRCIAVEQKKINLHKFHNSEQELGFYKFYYQLLNHWILDFNDYAIFCDFKSNRRSDRLHVLKNCLNNANLTSQVLNVQATKSKESVLIQLADVLTGAASASLNGTSAKGSSKNELIGYIESKLGRKIEHTFKSEQKFNVFIIDLKGGW
jgi:hypothetical protein